MLARFQPCRRVCICRSHFGKQERRREAVGGHLNVRRPRLAAVVAEPGEDFLAVEAEGVSQRDVSQLVRSGEALDRERTLGRNDDPRSRDAGAEQSFERAENERGAKCDDRAEDVDRACARLDLGADAELLV